MGKLIEFPQRVAATTRTSISQVDMVKLIVLERHKDAAQLSWMEWYLEIAAALKTGIPIEPGIHSVRLVEDQFSISDWPVIKYTRMEVR